MALINCVECGKEISDKAETCPHCGVSFKAKSDKKNATSNISVQSRKVTQSTIESKTNEASSVIGVSVLIIIVIIFLLRACSGDDETKVETPSTTEESSESTEITEEQKDAAIRLIELNGYTCNSVASMRRFLTSEGYHVYCDDHRYSYEIENKGGNWIVTVQ